MRAVACADTKLSVVELPDPSAGRGQLVLDVLRCGICGSDLHAREHCDGLAEVMEELDYDAFMRTTSATVLGHEFVGEVRERGRGVRREFREGAHVVSFPLVRHGKDAHPIGLSPRAPGGYAERVLVEQSMSFVVPNGLSPDVAVLTEPMAVALHAVNKAEISRRDVAIVLGCGPVGLAVICWLKARGVRTIVASDLSAGRRALAERCGADVVVDPTDDSPYAVADSKHVTSAPDLFRFAVGSMDRLRRVPGWRHVFRAADAVGAAAAGQRPAAGRQVRGHDRADAARLEPADDGEPDRTAAEHDRDVAPGDVGLVDRVQRYRHRLGEHRDVWRQPVGHHERHRVLHEHLLGVPARRQG